MTALSYDDVIQKLPEMVAECLGLESADIAPEFVFCSEGESIELLDLNFRCEKAFGIKSPFKLFLGSRDLLTVDSEGQLTAEALRLIRDTYPFFAATYEAAGRTQLKPIELLDYFTVDMIARFVVQASEEQARSQAA